MDFPLSAPKRTIFSHPYTHATLLFFSILLIRSHPHLISLSLSLPLWHINTPSFFALTSFILTLLPPFHYPLFHAHTLLVELSPPLSLSAPSLLRTPFPQRTLTPFASPFSPFWSVFARRVPSTDKIPDFPVVRRDALIPFADNYR